MQIEVLGERYQLQDPIGRGGMATIYRGRDLRMDRTVAIKVLREVYSTDPKFVTRFQREAKAASALQHPNIVQVFDYGQSDGNYFIVMELIEGTDLRRYLRSRGVLAIDRAIIIAHDIALGLGAAHRRQIVHRDVKPQNILVGRDGSIKLTDFGIASVYKDINAERLTTTGMTLGTVQYYAPEQAQGEIVNPAADVYALGIVMYEMLTGRTPFDGDTPVAVAMQHIQDAPLPPSQLNPNIPPALEEIILRCLEKVPEMRYRDGNTLARALEVLGEDEIKLASSAPGTNSFSTAGPTVPPRPTASVGPRALSGENGTRGTAGSAGGAGVISRPETGFTGSSLERNATTQMDQQQVAYAQSADLDMGETRPFRKDDISSDRESRIAGIVTIVILVATLLLLGFSVYLAGELGLIPPFFGQQNPQQNVEMSTVPNLIGLTYEDAKRTAADAGFTIKAEQEHLSGKVAEQSIPPNTQYRRGSTIVVKMVDEGVQVPSVVNLTLAEARQKLNSEGIQFTVEEDDENPHDPTQGPNIVTRVDPKEGTVLKAGQTVTLYVTNYTDISITPTQPPVIKKTPTQEVGPTPTQEVEPTAPPTQEVEPTAPPTQETKPTPTPTATPTQPTPTATPITGGAIP